MARTTFLRADSKIEVPRRELNQSVSLVDKILAELGDEAAARHDLGKLRAKLNNMRTQQQQRSLTFA